MIFHNMKNVLILQVAIFKTFPTIALFIQLNGDEKIRAAQTPRSPTSTLKP